MRAVFFCQNSIINALYCKRYSAFFIPKTKYIALRAHVLNTTLKGSFFMSNFLYSCGDINSGIADCQSELTFKKIRRKNGGTQYVRILKSTVQ